MATTIDLGGVNNTLTLSDLDYVIIGTNGNNTLTIGNGNSGITVGNGNNTFTLGTGNNNISAGVGNNTITTTGFGTNTVTLTDGNNTVTMANGTNQITVGNGQDSITTGDGNSTIVAGNGTADTITVGMGSNSISIGTGVADIVHTGAGKNTVTVSGVAVGPDSILGALTSGDGTGNKLVLTTAGALTVSGISGFDSFQLANGAPNTLTLGDSNFLRLPSGLITITDGGSGDTVNAAALGVAHAVAIHAGVGADMLTGGAGNDIFYDDGGHATIDGGAGTNTAVFSGTRASYVVSPLVLGTFSVVGGTTANSLRNVQFLTFSDGTIAAPCFVAGSGLLTTNGSVAVEDLRVGDSLVTRDGVGTVVWMGFRHVECGRHPRPREVWPVRVRRDAFAPGQPQRDLLLSPDHAVYFDGALIPIRYLVNDATIVAEQRREVTYWHVELERHSIVEAEGLPCESYLNTGNRGAFANGGAAVQLHPDFALRVWAEKGCVPLVHDGAALHAARSFLLARAEALGHVSTSAPELCLLLDGKRIAPIIDGRWHRFSLNGQASCITLVSRSAVPAHIRNDVGDGRQLGVAVSGIRLDGRTVALTDTRLGSGWHDHEVQGDGSAWRWSDGAAGLAVDGGVVLEIEVVMTARYWVEPAPERTARVSTG